MAAIALALVLSFSSESRARSALSAHPAPQQVAKIGTLRVERYGSGSPAMIFIPGLACGSWVWSEAVAHYAATHAVYLVTLAGFDGTPDPPPDGSPLDLADASLLALVTRERLDRPILVGHSLGGFLALRFGEEHATLVRGVVSVDYGPVFAGAAEVTADERASAADDLAREMSTESSSRYADSQAATVASMVTDPADVDRIAALESKSDQKIVAAYAADLFRGDLRPGLPSLSIPTLAIVSVPNAPQGFEGPAAAKLPMADREEAYKAFYTTLFQGAPDLRIVTIPHSKQFVMIDRPQPLYDAIAGFTAALR